MTRISATTNIKRGLDLALFDDADFGPIIANDPEAVFVRVAGRRLELEGDYTYSASSGEITGEVTALQLSALMQVDGDAGLFPILRATELSLDAGELVDLIQTNDGDGLISALLSGDDVLRGSKWRDVLEGMGGDDTLVGLKGSDTLLGGEGNDVLRGGAGFDVLRGGNGRDRLEGGFKDDILSGAAGRDTLLGGRGDDQLEGGAGVDRLRGGLGADAFVFRGAHGRDRIGDFSEEDTVVLGDEYWAGQATATDVLTEYATVGEEGISIVRGENSIFIAGLTDLDDLANRLRTIEQEFG